MPAAIPPAATTRAPQPAPAARDTADLRRALAIAALWSVTMIVLFRGVWAEDLAALYMAGHFWATGETGLIYAAPPGFFGGTPAAWEPALAAMGGAGHTAYPFVYPPLWAALAAPLARALPPEAFFTAALVVQVPLLAASSLLAARLARPAAMPLALWVGLSLGALPFTGPGALALFQNQPSITMVFLILLSAERLQAGRPVAAGLALGLAAALKLSPAFFALMFLVPFAPRALAAFAATAAALALASGLAAGHDLSAAFLDLSRAATATVLVSTDNLSLRAVEVLLRAALSGDIADIADNGPHILGGLAGPAALLPPVLLAAACLALLARARQRPAFATLLALGVLMPLCGPIGWLHYYLLPVFLLPGLAARAPSLLRPVAALVLVISLPALVAAHALPYGQTAYVIAACLAWSVLLLALLRGAPGLLAPAAA